jgi:hypothetical protein
MPGVESTKLRKPLSRHYFWTADDTGGSTAAVAPLLIVVVGSHSVVSRKTLQIVVLVCLVAFALAYPVVESLDHWDAATPASDSELQAIVVLTFAGAIFLLTQMLAALPLSIATQPPIGLCFRALLKKHIVLFSPDLTASPPVALRI